MTMSELNFALRQKTPKHVMGGWSHSTDQLLVMGLIIWYLTNHQDSKQQPFSHSFKNVLTTALPYPGPWMTIKNKHTDKQTKTGILKYGDGKQRSAELSQDT
jgi:hypothetical protein